MSRGARQRWRLRREWCDLQRSALERAEREGLDFIDIASPMLRKSRCVYTARGFHKLLKKFYCSGLEASQLVYEKPLLGSSEVSFYTPVRYAQGAL